MKYFMRKYLLVLGELLTPRRFLYSFSFKNIFLYTLEPEIRVTIAFILVINWVWFHHRNLTSEYLGLLYILVFRGEDIQIFLQNESLVGLILNVFKMLNVLPSWTLLIWNTNTDFCGFPLLPWLHCSISLYGP